MGSLAPSIDLSILKQKYPAKAHCRKVVNYIKTHPEASTAEGTSTTLHASRPEGIANGVIYLESQKTYMVEDDDQAQHFRQRRYFFYLSGCKLPDSYLTYEVSSDNLTLYIPPIDPESVIWSGLPESIEEALAKYDVDEIKHTTDLSSTLTNYAKQGLTLYTIHEQLTQPHTFTSHATCMSILKHAIDECRVTKSPYEIACLAKANQISTIAHLSAQRAAKAGAQNEAELYGAFIGTCISHGAFEQAYHSIVATGHSCATLHYVKNDSPLTDRLNVLMDAGAEWECYCADITRTWPVNGHFTSESKTIYDIVDDMQRASFAMIKAGVRWEDVHEKAHRVGIRGLLEAGIFKREYTEEEIFESRVSTAFFPHGLGHYLGLDTHDTGGHANYEDEDLMFRYLRVRGQVPRDAVITVEPGIYFCRFIIEPLLRGENEARVSRSEDGTLSKRGEDESESRGGFEKLKGAARFIDTDVLERYWDVGGVRIEDDVWVTEEGYVNLTDTSKL